MWHCQQACVWGSQQWAMHPHMAFFQNKQLPAWHGTMFSKIGRATTTRFWLDWSQAQTMNFCCSRASRMPRKASVVRQWMQRNCIAVLVRNPIDWSHDVSSHNHRETKGDRRCLCWFAIWAIQWREQAHPLLSAATSSAPAVCLCLRTAFALGGRRVGVRRWGLARRISVLSYEQRWGFMLHSDLLPPWMATTRFHDLYIPSTTRGSKMVCLGLPIWKV